eukprot:381249_1
MSTFSTDDILFEGWVEKKSKHSDSYKKRAGCLSSDTFYVFKKPKKYTNAMDKIPLTKIASIILPTEAEAERVFIILDKDNQDHHFKSNNKQKWADLMKKQCDEIHFTTALPPSPSLEDGSEIKENIAIDNDLSVVPIISYNRHTNATSTDVDTELDPTTIDNYDYAILDEIDFYILDLVNGYLRELCDDRMPSPTIQNLCTLFYFVRKFDTRRLRRDCDFA